MPTFFCEAIEGGVTPISLEIVADSQDAAVEKLNALGLMVKSIVERPPATPPSPLLAILTSPVFRTQQRGDAFLGTIRAIGLIALAAFLAVIVFPYPLAALLGPVLLWVLIEFLHRFRTPDTHRNPPP